MILEMSEYIIQINNKLWSLGRHQGISHTEELRVCGRKPASESITIVTESEFKLPLFLESTTQFPTKSSLPT